MEIEFLKLKFLPFVFTKMETLFTKKGYKVEIDLDDCPCSREDYAGDCVPKLCFLSRERFNFSNGLDLNDAYIAILAWREDRDEMLKNGEIDEEDIEELKKLEEKYNFLPVWIYEHSAYRFYLGNMHWRDNRYWGVLAVEKDDKINLDAFMDDFTNRFNGWIYCGSVYQKHEYRDKDWNVFTDWDWIDGCWGFWSYEDALDWATSEYWEVEKD